MAGFGILIGLLLSLSLAAGTTIAVLGFLFAIFRGAPFKLPGKRTSATATDKDDKTRLEEAQERQATARRELNIVCYYAILGMFIGFSLKIVDQAWLSSIVDRKQQDLSLLKVTDKGQPLPKKNKTVRVFVLHDGAVERLQELRSFVAKDLEQYTEEARQGKQFDPDFLAAHRRLRDCVDGLMDGLNGLRVFDTWMADTGAIGVSERLTRQFAKVKETWLADDR